MSEPERFSFHMALWALAGLFFLTIAVIQTIGCDPTGALMGSGMAILCSVRFDIEYHRVNGRWR